MIDGLALRCGAVAAGYLLFLNVLGSVPLACALALALGTLLELALGNRSRPARRTAAQARAELLALAFMPEPEAAAALTALVRARWPGETFRLAPLLKHPDAAAGANDILALWKAARGEARLVIAATCQADAGALAFARTLSGPAVVVLDARALLRLLRRAPEAGAPSRRPQRRLRRLLTGLGRPLPPRLAALGPVMLVMYLGLGHPMYLFGGLWLVFRFLSHLAADGPRRRLFP